MDEKKYVLQSERYLETTNDVTVMGVKACMLYVGESRQTKNRVIIDNRSKETSQEQVVISVMSISAAFSVH